MSNHSTSAISKQDLVSLVPSAFQTKASPKVSSKYCFVSTERLIDDLAILGFQPVVAKQNKIRKGVTGFQKHFIVFRNEEFVIKNEKNPKLIEESLDLILSNSHDGTSHFNFQAGIFRLVCDNGLLAMDKKYGSFKIRHMSYSFEELRNQINELVSNIPQIFEKVKLMKDIKMSDDKIAEFALRACKIRWEKEVKIDVNELLKSERVEDQSKDLWTIYNVVQEKLVKGGFTYYTDKGKERRSRAVKNFESQIKLNEELYELVEQYKN